MRIPSIENIGSDEIVNVRGLITDPKGRPVNNATCLLYTSDAADERSSVDLGGRRIIKKQTEDKIMYE